MTKNILRRAMVAFIVLATVSIMVEPASARSRDADLRQAQRDTAMNDRSVNMTEREIDTVVVVEEVQERPFEREEQPTETSEPPAEEEIVVTEHTLRITLGELGLLQLAAHDLFDVDRETAEDRENGKLDLSTVLHHGLEAIALGGEPRNRENSIIATVGAQYGAAYLHYIERGYSEATATRRLIAHYHRELAEVYEKVFNQPFPDPVEGEVTMTENVALRTIHDFLPGEIIVGGETFDTVARALFGKTLTESELAAATDPLDGQLHPVFLDVVIFIPPDTIMHISLLERDSSFASDFGSDFSFEYFMHELEDGSYDADEAVTKHIQQLFAKGLNF
ncbi:hypothetical protein N9L26_01110 [Candidatus Pacebacteria bacterium]|nr:hypothetical protein [Candidatus Paceibacterota bacterium]